ncbi:MAG: putative ABC transporter permease [Bacilli bacterium]
MVKEFEKLNTKNYKFDFKMNICKYLLIFFISAFIGYIYEVIFYFLFDHELVNRGFLYGPYLPVYGFGAIILIILLKRFKKNPLVVFLLSMFITGVVEYFTGFLMWEIYHKMWWDYSGLFLNIDGYVCLRSVLTFGIGGLLLVYLVEPLVCKFISKIKAKKVYKTSCFLLFVILIDFVLTIVFRNKI